MDIDNVTPAETEVTDTSAENTTPPEALQTAGTEGLKGETPAAGQGAPTETPTEGLTPAVVPPAYSPDFKYKANNQVRELDKRLHSIIKDKETEEWVKDLVSRADGLDAVKSDREQFRNQYSNLATEANKVLSEVDRDNYGKALELLGVDTKDMQRVMAGLGFSKRDILEYAVRLANLTPEQEQSYSRERELELRGREQQSYVQRVEQRLQEADQRFKELELKQTLSLPEYASIATAFDQSNGQNAFWNQVCERGDYYFQKGVDKSVAEVVAEVARVLKPYATVAQPSASPQAPQPVKSSAGVPVIPTTGSGSASPARKMPTNVKALKAFAANLED